MNKNMNLTINRPTYMYMTHNVLLLNIISAEQHTNEMAVVMIDLLTIIEKENNSKLQLLRVKSQDSRTA